MIRAIDKNHAAELAALAQNIYREYYLHLWLPGGADWYMHEHAYHPGKIKTELEDAQNLHYIVYDNDAATGYLKLKLGSKLPGDEQRNALEIERIYLHRHAAGKGTGKQLMLFSEDIARLHHKDLIFLKAMDSSHDAIAFYKKLGYRECGTHTLPFPLMKEEYRGMVVLKKDLD